MSKKSFLIFFNSFEELLKSHLKNIFFPTLNIFCIYFNRTFYVCIYENTVYKSKYFIESLRN